MLQTNLIPEDNLCILGAALELKEDIEGDFWRKVIILR
jgi:hypothetical protein